MEAIKLLESDPEIAAIFINIFGGIMSCDMIASSIIRAAEEIKPTKPIVLRLKGNNSDSAKEMIESVRQKENLGIYFCEEIDEAATLAVKLANQMKS